MSYDISTSQNKKEELRKAKNKRDILGTKSLYITSAEQKTLSLHIIDIDKTLP